MKFFNLISIASLLTHTGASPAPVPVPGSLVTNSTENPDIVAHWTLTPYTDGGCTNSLGSVGGNTPSGCVDLNQQAHSYNYLSIPDTQTSLRFVLQLYASNNCVNQLVTDRGTSVDCHSLTFQSWQVVASLGG